MEGLLWISLAGSIREFENKKARKDEKRFLAAVQTKVSVVT